jgi:diguanylate cyclase (GGDEF)-like protein/PAS domain S-box-containing protein
MVAGVALLSPTLLVAIRPSAFGSGVFFNLYNVSMLASVAGLVFGVWRWRPKPLWPWALIALTIALWVVGDLVYGTYASTPAVSPADVFYLAGYVTLLLSVLRLVRDTIRQRNADSVLDMAIIGVAAVYASWALVIAPTLGRNDVSFAARVILVVYPVMDAALLVLLAQLLLRPHPTMSHVFLALGMAIVSAGDIGFAILQQTDSFTSWSILDASWPLGYALIALAALHPSVRVQPAGTTDEERLVDPRRLLAASAAVLAIPTAVVIAYGVSGKLDRVSYMTASICLFALVSLRMLRLHHQAERAQVVLRRSHQYFLALAMHSSDGFAVLADDGTVSDASPELEHVIGWAREDIVGKPIGIHLDELVHPGDAVLATSFLERARRASKGRSVEVEVRLRRPDRSFGWVEVHATNLLEDPAVRGVVLNMHDIEQRKRAEATAERERARLEEAQRVAGVGSFEQDTADLVIYPSAELCRLLHLPVVSYFPVETLMSLVHPDDRQALATAMQANVEAGATMDLVHRLMAPDGSVRWVHVRAQSRPAADGMRPRVIGTVLDITDRMQAEKDLAYQGLHDALTGFANRTLFLDRLDLTLRQAERGTNPIAVLLMDIDDFKGVNDALGHAAGDQLLADLAQRLALVTRAGDTIARLGGDEFAVLLGSGAMPRTAEDIARRIARQLTTPFHIAGTDVTASVSIGIAVGQPSRADSGDLLRDADLAMYLAKQRGKGRFEMARPDMQDEAIRHLGVVTDLRNAQAAGELEVFYQAIVTVADATPAGAEALIRWNHPHRGHVSPVEFIRDAETTGLIIPIGNWILNEACRQAQAWRRAGTVDDDFYISVNLSPRQLAEPGLVGNVTRALDDSGLPPRALVLEITESTLMGDFDTGVAQLQALKDLGLRIALDDYGTGYSSLNRLAKLPVDIVKIDKSFIDQLTVSEVGRALVQSVIDVAKTLAMKTVAEGVERPDQRVALQELQCDFIQGYLFAKPTPPADTADLLRRLAAPVDQPQTVTRFGTRNQTAKVSP